MKKLMIAAAAAAMVGGASAICIDGGDCGVATGANIWDVKFSVKTTAVKAKADKCTACTDVAFRKQATAKITGWIWNEDTTCGDCALDMGQSEDSLRMVLLWNKKYQFGADLTLQLLGQIENGRKLEVYGDLADGADIDLRLAGYGTFTKYVKTLTGNFAGCVDGDAGNAECNLLTGYGYDCSTVNLDNPTVAFGTWSIKYNATASKKAAKKMAGYAIVKPEDGEEEAEEAELDDVVASMFNFSKYNVEDYNEVTIEEIGDEPDAE